MWLLWLCMAALAGHLEDARALMAEGLPETAVVVLDPHLATDPAAALLRFQLAERLGDPEALQAVLSEEVVAHLPWSTRDEAHLLMARRDVATGHIEQARVHLELVFPDADAYGPSRLLVGDLEASEARYLAAVHTWREAVMRGEDVALLRIAEVYERLGRPADAVHYLEMIPAEHPSWWRSRVPLARDLLAIGAEGEAMAVLLDLAKKAVPGDWWVPELQFLRAQAWSQRCVEARAREIRTRAAARLAPVLVLFEAEIQQGYSPGKRTSAMRRAAAYPARGTTRSWGEMTCGRSWRGWCASTTSSCAWRSPATTRGWRGSQHGGPPRSGRSG